MSRVIAVADIGGTNARFALAEIDGQDVRSVGEPVTLGDIRPCELRRCLADLHPSQSGCGAELPGPRLCWAGDHGDVRLTNNAWSINRQALHELGIEHAVIVNDFGAVAHAVATLDDTHFQPLCGPVGPMQRQGVTTIVGPGTGLGVAIIVASERGWTVVETEGGHVDFAPTDPVEDSILSGLRQRFGRVSVNELRAGRAWEICTGR